MKLPTISCSSLYVKDDAARISTKKQFLDLVLKNKVIPSLCCKLKNRKFIKTYDIHLPEEIGFGEDLASTLKIFLYCPKIKIVD